MLRNLPSDTLIDICSHLELRDVNSFVSICSAFRKLADSKTLWISALNKAKEARNLACPLGADINQMPVDELRRVARRTDKLDRNWSLDRPRIMRAVRSVCYSDTENIETASILAAIPATSLVVLYLREQKRIVVCDGEGKIPLFSTRVGQILRRAHFDEPQRHLIAMTVTEDLGASPWLKVYSIEHWIGRTPSIKELFSSILPAQHDVFDMFLTTNIVGLVCCLEDKSFCVHAVNFINNFSVDLPTPFGNFMSSPLILSSVINKIPYITVALTGRHDDVYEVYRCPIDKLVSEEDLDLEQVTAEIGPSIVRVAKIIHSDIDGDDRETAELKLSSRGLHLLLVSYVSGLAVTTHSFFWPLENLHSIGIGGVSIVEGLACVKSDIDGGAIAHFQGHTAPWLVATSHSGIYSAVIILCNSHVNRDMPYQLHLLQRVLHPPNIHVCILDVPHYIELDQIYALAIDERYGVIYLSHERGHLFSLPYS